MEDAEAAGFSAKVFWIGCYFQQRRRTGFEQESEQNLLVLPDQRHQCMRDAEDQMKVAHRKQFSLSGAEPFLASVRLALRTVAITAGVVGDGLITAVSALIAMSAQRGRTAARNGVEDLDLRDCVR
jgi:hypothetical protein